MTPEEKARQEIDAQHTRCGWTVQIKNRLNLVTSPGVAVCELSFATGTYSFLIDAKAVGTIDALEALDTANLHRAANTFFEPAGQNPRNHLYFYVQS
jgi:hypothetical protein